MKIYLKIGIIAIVLFVLGYLGYKVGNKMQQKKDVAERLETIPSFGFQALDGSVFTKSNLKVNSPTVLIYFNSSCDLCQYEAQSISDNLRQFKNVQFVFVSTEPISIIQEFAEQYQLNNQQNITFLHDNLSIFSSQLGTNSIPYLLIYDKDQKLIKKHKGQLNAKGILRILNK